MDVPGERRAGNGRRRTDGAAGFSGDEDDRDTVSAVLGDEHDLFIEALTSALGQHRVRVLGAGRTLPELVNAVRQHDPDVCLLGRPSETAREQDGVAQVLAANPRTKVVVLTADAASESVADALRAGACGCVHKSRGIENLRRAIDHALAGQIVIDAPQAHRPPSDEGGEHMRKLARQLTGRERQCLALLVEGFSTEAMAKRLGVSTATVRGHVSSVLTKLCVHSRLAAVSCTIRYGLLDPRRTSNVP